MLALRNQARTEEFSEWFALQHHAALVDGRRLRRDGGRTSNHGCVGPSAEAKVRIERDWFRKTNRWCPGSREALFEALSRE